MVPLPFPIRQIFTKGVTTLSPPFIDLSFSLSCVLLCWVRLSFRVFGLCSFASLACFVSACFLLSLSLSPPALSLCLTLPSGVVPGLSGRRLVRISSATLTSPFLSFRFPSLVRPSQFSSFNGCSSVGLLAADWSGISLRWFLTILPTQHCLWPQTGPGAVALQF